jgi:hypothetical protein
MAFAAKGVKMPNKDEDEGRKRPKKNGREGVVRIANTLTPYQYALKSPAVPGGLASDRGHGSFALGIPGHVWETRQVR